MSRSSLEKKLKDLRRQLSKTYVDSKKTALKDEIALIKEQIKAEDKALEELQEELPW